MTGQGPAVGGPWRWRDAEPLDQVGDVVRLDTRFEGFRENVTKHAGDTENVHIETTGFASEAKRVTQELVTAGLAVVSQGVPCFDQGDFTLEVGQAGIADEPALLRQSFRERLALTGRGEPDREMSAAEHFQVRHAGLPGGLDARGAKRRQRWQVPLDAGYLVPDRKGKKRRETPMRIDESRIELVA